jgi:FAD/FMN-containing dehydrogenase
VLPKLVTYPTSPAYNSFVSSYWSQLEARITPDCVVSPANAHDVSVAIKTLTQPYLGCKFAVRSGGHTPFAGSANIGSGATVNLGNLNQISLSSDKKSVTVGSGQNWGKVYSFLKPYGLAVAGVRAASVGVGGSTLGGA